MNNPFRLVTKQDLKDFYNKIKPYLGYEEMDDSDMDDVVTPLPSVGARYHKYSTEEQVVGEWIDGSTLYEKTIVAEAPTVVTQGTEVHIFVDIGAVIDYAEIVICNQASGVSFLNSPTKYWLQTTETPNYARPVYYAIPFNNTHENVSYRNKIRLTCSDTALNDHTFYITIRYTKTTA